VAANPDQPFQSPDERLREIAAILARGVIRLRENRSQIRFLDPENNEESGNAPLEVPEETVLSVTSG